MLMGKAVSLIRRCINLSVLQCSLIMYQDDLKARSNSAALQADENHSYYCEAMIRV